MKKGWKFWLLGLLNAAIGGAAGGVLMVIVDPTDFNVFGGGLQKLATVCVAFAIVAIAGYVQKHPLPDDDDQTVSRSTTRAIGLWLMAAAALGSLLSVGCGGKTPPATPDQVRVVLYESLAAVQDAEMALYSAGQIARPAHQAFNAKLAPALEAGLAADRVLRTWSAGAPPVELQLLITRVGDLSQAVAQLLPDGMAKTTIVDRIQKARALIDEVWRLVGGAS